MRIILTGGGTGGHVVPNLAVIEDLKKRRENNELLYIGKADNFGKRVTPNTEHQGMPPSWNKFRLDVLNPEASHI